MTAETLTRPAATKEVFLPEEDLEDLGDVALDGVPVTVEADSAANLHQEFRSVSPRPESTLRGRFGRHAAIRAATEIVGLGVDAALMGAGSAGVGLMQNVAYREITATAPEVAVLDRLLHRRGHEHDTKGAKRLLAKMGGVALGVSVAVAAQKAGLDLAGYMHEGHGVGHFALPLTSKVGAMTGLSAARRNVSRLI